MARLVRMSSTDVGTDRSSTDSRLVRVLVNFAGHCASGLSAKQYVEQYAGPYPVHI